MHMPAAFKYRISIIFPHLLQGILLKHLGLWSQVKGKSDPHGLFSALFEYILMGMGTDKEEKEETRGKRKRIHVLKQ